MRVLLQRVREASVEVEGQEIARIGPGLLLLVGVARGDTEAEARALAEKVATLRVFPQEGAHFDRSLLDTGNEALVVSQFTLYGDTRRGRRPSFDQAAPAGEAEPLVEAFAAALRALGVPVQTGRFGAMMQVALVNDGPVTLLLEMGPKS
jgi:D-tyrosyl-tRNA(Tyr) deacylase